MNNFRRDKIALAALVIASLVLNVIPFHHRQTAYCSNPRQPYPINITAYGFPVPYLENNYAQYDCMGQDTITPELFTSSRHNYNFLIQAVFADLLVAGAAYMLLQIAIELRRDKK